jgi:hypothetical protein
MGLVINDNPATLKHLNVRKDGPEEEQELAVDVKLSTRIPASALPPLVADEGDIQDSLWFEGGSPRFWSISELRFDTQFEHHEIWLSGMRFSGVKLKKFVVTPQDGHEADVLFQAQIHPSSTEVATLAEYVTEEVRLAVAPMDELPLQGGGREDAA